MSEVWNHFFMAPNGLSVTCNHCGKFMKRSDSSTKSMWGHLKAFHADLVGEETFRLKRTRRMRGEGGGTKKAGSGGKTAPKCGKNGGRKNRKKTVAASSEGTTTSSSSSSSASSSSGSDEMEELEGSECSSRASSQELGERVARSTPEGLMEATKVKAEEKSGEAEGAKPNMTSTSPMAKEVEKLDTEEPKQTEGGEEEGKKTPTQPYIKRKKQRSQQQQQHSMEESAEPLAHSAASPPVQTEQKPQIDESVVVKPASPVVSPTTTTTAPTLPTVSATDMTAPVTISSGASSAFSKYSTAALLMDNNNRNDGKKSPAHGAEAPKHPQQQQQAGWQPNKQQQQQQQLPAPRPKYGLEAITGLNPTQLAMLGVADPSMMTNLEAAATMQLMGEYQQQQQQKNANVAVHKPAAENLSTVAQPPKTHMLNQSHQNGQSVQQQQLNELLALYASAAASSTLQPQHQPQKIVAGGDQQQLAQAAAMASWLYNLEWLAAARMSSNTNNGLNSLNMLSATQQQTEKKSANSGSVQQLGRATQPQPAQMYNMESNNNALIGGGLPLLSALSLSQNGNTGPNGAMNGHAKNNSAASVKTETKQHHPSNNHHQQQAQKRKSPVEERECAASLLVLADGASTVSMAEQRIGGASPPKSRKVAATTEQRHHKKSLEGQKQVPLVPGGDAVAESLVLYGMHRIAMDMHLSYSVHANKAGKAEYAFYCTNAGTTNANIQRMVTLTESPDQVLHIREYANGTVVAEECWPKSAEPNTLLLSLRDKCQRRLCA